MLDQMIFLAQATGETPKNPGSGFVQMMIIFGMIFMVFYFLILRPQKKRDRQRREMLSQVKRGDQVRTIGGIIGEVVSAKEACVIIKVHKESGTTLKLSRSAVSALVIEEEESNKKAEE